LPYKIFQQLEQKCLIHPPMMYNAPPGLLPNMYHM